jgi:hypothetical protein
MTTVFEEDASPSLWVNPAAGVGEGRGLPQEAQERAAFVRSTS